MNFKAFPMIIHLSKSVESFRRKLKISIEFFLLFRHFYFSSYLIHLSKILFRIGALDFLNDLLLLEIKERAV